MRSACLRVEIDHRKTKLPVRIADIALVTRTHRSIFDAEEHAPVNESARVRTEAVRVALEQAYALVLDELLCGIRAVLRDFVPVADVQIADANEIVGEFARPLMARDVFDL